ncbi:MAG: 30S ribosomal protein S9 [Candidatus Latescibacteria bacterium]|nr:30S ribosomal protein S9 [Candidatus Latescibacterota bacterium]
MANALIATGRRKESAATVRLVSGGGQISVNGRSPIEYFGRETLVMLIEQPLKLTEMIGKFNIHVMAKGGGLAGQAGAVRLGIARALLKHDEALRKTLRMAGFLTRDPRMVERKKPGQPGARKRFQFSKR